MAETRIRHLADGAALVECGGPLAAANESALSLANDLAERAPPGLLDAVPGARTVLLLFDPDRLPHDAVDGLVRAGAEPRERSAGRTVSIQAHYGGPDLDELARAAGFAAAELARLHARAEHRVAFLGFAPGFAYLLGAPPELTAARLATPRVSVPAGALAVADGYSGIYPGGTPGGWRLIGRVAVRLFDPDASPPALLRPGDRVEFEPVPSDVLVSETERKKLKKFFFARRDTEGGGGRQATRRVFRVVSPGAFTTVQGGPRYGWSGSGVPAGGAMDLSAIAEANAAVGNAPFAPGLEMTLVPPELELLEDAVLAIGGAPVEAVLSGRALAGRGPHAGRKGERLRLGPVRHGVRAYLAVQGGLALPPPGYPVHALGRGDELPPSADARLATGRVSTDAKVGGRVSDAPVPAEPRWTTQPLQLRAVSGPQADRFTAAGRETFFSAEYRVSPQSDRRGVRLLGPRVDLHGPADLPPEGTAPGAVQVPGDGLPIVLAPDRPVTGGYAKIATVVSADLPLLAQARPGTTIRFRPATLAEALAARRAAR